MSRFDDKHATAKAIIRRLAAKENITLTLQDELSSGKGLKRTAAFNFIVNARLKDEAQMAKHAEDEEVVPAESMVMRREAEEKLHDDIVAKVQRAIVEEEAAARKRNMRLKVQQLLKMILGLTHVAMGGTQVGLAA